MASTRPHSWDFSSKICDLFFHLFAELTAVCPQQRPYILGFREDDTHPQCLLKSFFAASDKNFFQFGSSAMVSCTATALDFRHCLIGTPRFFKTVTIPRRIKLSAPGNCPSAVAFKGVVSLLFYRHMPRYGTKPEGVARSADPEGVVLS